jgi:hypothetical protein
MSEAITIGPVRVTFPALFTPEQTENGEKYRMTLLIDKATKSGQEIVARLKALAKAAVEETWPSAEKRPRKLIGPIRDADDPDACEDGVAPGEKWTGYAGHWFCSVGTKFKPPVYNQKCELVIDPDKVYGGVWMMVNLDAYTYENKKSGVAFGLQAAQIHHDDERFGGGGKTAQEAGFAAIDTPVAPTTTEDAGDDYLN